MSERFENLKKIPDGPAARHLAESGVKLDTKLEAPVSAPVSVVLAELEEKEAWVDMLKVLSGALPARESVWWACLAARDIAGETPTPVLQATEAWVFGPNDENREKLGAMLEAAESDDDTTLAGTAAYYADGTLGTGDLAEQPAPSGAVASCVFGQNLSSLEDHEDPEARMQYLIERGLDIARGGNGRVPETEAEAEGEADAGASDGGAGEDGGDDAPEAAQDNAPAEG